MMVIPRRINCQDWLKPDDPGDLGGLRSVCAWLRCQLLASRGYCTRLLTCKVLSASKVNRAPLMQKFLLGPAVHRSSVSVVGKSQLIINPDFPLSLYTIIPLHQYPIMASSRGRAVPCCSDTLVIVPHGATHVIPLSRKPPTSCIHNALTHAFRGHPILRFRDLRPAVVPGASLPAWLTT